MHEGKTPCKFDIVLIQVDANKTETRKQIKGEGPVFKFDVSNLVDRRNNP